MGKVPFAVESFAAAVRIPSKVVDENDGLNSGAHSTTIWCGTSRCR